MLALVAGRGQLPERVVAAAETTPLVCALEGQEPDTLTVDIAFRLETLGSLLLELGTRGVTEVCFCGSIERPDIDPTRLDAETAPLVPLLQEALAKGDDGALRVVISLFEQTGFAIRGAHEIAPDITVKWGVLTDRQPRDVHREDAFAAAAIFAQMGAEDLGQACVIRKGVTLVREDQTGTDAMLRGLGLDWDVPGLWQGDSNTLSSEGRAWLAKLSGESFDAPGAGGVLFKAPKPGQERRADLPTIGPDTAVRAAMAGLDGIVVEAEAVIVLEQARVVALLDAMDMFLWARDP